MASFSCYAASAVLLFAGYHIWREIDVAALAPAHWAASSCLIAGIAIACYGGLPGVTAARKENAAAAGLLFAFAAYAATFVAFRFSGFGSDALLFNAYSAHIAAAGHNPYAESMEPAFAILGAPISLATATTAGSAIFVQSYPALGFLLYVPLVLAGINVIWLNVAIHAALMALLIWAAPRPLKAVAPLVLFVDPTYTDYTLGSVTDIVWVLPVALCARYWYARPVAAATFLGLACAIKQQPWFIVPFAAVFWTLTSLEQRRWRAVAYPALALLAAFFVPNAPYLLGDPQGWARGILTPIQGDLVAFGSGIMQLVTANVFAIDRHVLATLSTSLLGVTIVAYALYPRALGFLPFLAPGIALFFATRELQNYFMYWPVVLIVYNFWREEPQPARAGWRVPALSPVLLGTLAVALVGLLVVRGSTNPVKGVDLAIVRAEHDAGTGKVDAFTVRATNSDTVPHGVRFGVQLQGKGDDFLYWERTPQAVAPGESRTMRVAAPSTQLAVSPGHQTAQVVAIDADTANQTYSDPRVVWPMAGGLANPSLDAWQNGPPDTPVGWIYVASDLSMAYIRNARVQGRHAVAFDVAPPPDDDVRFVSLMQTVSGAPAPFTALLRPAENYTNGAVPRRLFGLQIADPIGRSAYFTINSNLHAPVVYRQGDETVFVMPGRVGEWNAVDVDPVALTKSAGLTWSDSRPAQIGAIAMVRKGEPASVLGAFGGITSP